MFPPSLRRAARRLTWIAWLLTAGFVSLALLRVSQGCRPDQYLDDRLDEFLTGHSMLWLSCSFGAFVFALPILLIAGCKMLLWFAGRPWRSSAEATRSMEMPPSRAEEIAERGIARLMELGYRLVGRSPTPGGGQVLTAVRRQSFLSNDPRRSKQRVEFRLTRERLELTHRFGAGQILLERGLKDYQEWLLGALLAGAPLDSPPGRISGSSLMCFMLGLVSAIGSAVLHLMPEEVRTPYVPLQAFLLVSGLVSIVVLSMAEGVFFKGKTCRTLTLAGLVLGLCGLYFQASRVDSWQRADWLASDDPALLCRAWHSAVRETLTGQKAGMPLTTRDREAGAYQARRLAQKRLIAMKEKAVLPLLTCMPSDRYSYMVNVLLERVGRPAVPILLEGLGHPDPAVRLRALRVLDNLPKNEETLRAVAGRVRDPHPEIRRESLHYLREDRTEDCAPLSGAARADLERALLELLRDSASEVREAAAEIAGTLKVREAVPLLLAMLSRPEHHYTQYRILGALREIGDPRALPALIALLGRGGGYPDHALEKFGVRAIEEILPLLATPAGDAARRALRSVAYADLEFPEPLLQRLLEMSEDPDVDTRQTALKLLAGARNQAAMDRATRALKGPDLQWVLWPLRKRGIATLDDVARALDSADQDLVWTTVGRLGEAEKPLLPRVIRFVESSAWKEQVRGAALWALGRLDPDRAAEVAERLAPDAPDRLCKEAATYVRSTPTLVRLLSDRRREVRWTAAQSLGKHPDALALPALIRALREDECESTRSMIARALSKYESTESVEALLESLSRTAHPGADGLPSSLWSALISGLGEQGNPQARPALRDALARATASGNEWARAEAAIGLGMTGDPGAIPAFLHSFERQMILSKGCANALARCGEEGVTELLALIDSEFFNSTFVTALGRSRSPRALARLLDLLDDPSPGNQSCAATALGSFGDRRAIPALLRTVENPMRYVAWSAVRSLEQLTGEKLSKPDLEKSRAAVREWAARNP